MSSNRIGYLRYQSTELLDLIAEYERLDGQRKEIINEINLKIFREFTKDSTKWSLVSLVTSTLDVLIGFATVVNEVNF